jgi:hypothetical protein
VNDYDMRLAWSEGWADFFETAVKSWLKANHPELLSTDLVVPIAQYVDTATVPGWFYISINQSNPELSVQGTDADTDSCLAGECQYAANEIAVANVLWQLMEGNGTNGYGMAPIWNSITDPGFMATSPHVNMESFFDALTSANTPSTADIQAVFASRSIDCAPDSRETDDSFATAGTYTGSQVHTLYSDATATHFDVDYVAFNVTSATVYTVTTSSLRSGAATHLDIFDPDMTLIASGDNAVPFNYNSNCDDFGCHVNGTDTLASSLTFSSPTGTAYVRILSSGSGSVFAGKYGSYILTIKP